MSFKYFTIEATKIMTRNKDIALQLVISQDFKKVLKIHYSLSDEFANYSLKSFKSSQLPMNENYPQTKINDN